MCTNSVNIEMVKLLLFVFISLFVEGCAVFIDGCPAYGCRPSGSFSFYLDFPKANASIDWSTSFIMNSIPNPLGCTSDAVSIICQSNGPFSGNKGYVSLYRENGKIHWRDDILVYPTLPLLDNYGDVTGTDGNNLVHYDADGTKYPKIDCGGLAPVYSTELIGDSFILLTSAKGDIVVRLTNGVPVGYIRLDDIIDNVKGTFLPIAQPVVNNMRFYVLTEFVPETQSFIPEYNTVQRLYAIDVHDSISDRITIGWYYTFKDVSIRHNSKIGPLIMSTEKHVDYIVSRTRNGSQGLLWKEKSKTIFVSLPPVFNSTKTATSLWGVHDNGSEPIFNFRTDFSVLHMASFEKDHCDDAFEDDTPVWVASNDIVCSVDNKGKVQTCFDISKWTSKSARISTKLSVIRNDDNDTDIVVFGTEVVTGGKVDLSRDQFSFSFSVGSTSSEILAIQLTTPAPTVLWSIPLPGGVTIKGQVTGSSGSDTSTKDKLIFYADNESGVAKIFSIS